MSHHMVVVKVVVVIVVVVGVAVGVTGGVNVALICNAECRLVFVRNVVMFRNLKKNDY